MKTSEKMREWNKPLLFFFEDSAHNYAVTNTSFSVFEHHLVLGGVVVLHDVGCCKGTYPELVQFVKERIYSNPTYKELFFDIPKTWDDIDVDSSTLLKGYLNASLDMRPSYRAQAISGYNSIYDCREICSKHGCHMDRGYQWSWCPNTRVFQRVK